MAHHHQATILWSAHGADITQGEFSRAHTWRFDGGIEFAASASPQVVPVPLSCEEAVDPEEAFVAAIASCHMLTFVHLASKDGLRLRAYEDTAVGTLEKNPEGKLALTRVALRPKLTFDGDMPHLKTIEKLHARAHEECFIANSVKTTISVEPGA